MHVIYVTNLTYFVLLVVYSTVEECLRTLAICFLLFQLMEIISYEKRGAQI